MAVLQAQGDGEHRGSDGSSESADSQCPLRFGGRIEVQACCIDGCQDGDRMIGESLTGRCEANASAFRFDQCSTGFRGQSRELLGHCRCREVVSFGDRAHGTQAGEFEEEMESTGFHRSIIH
jgi:hypothetical protein